MNSKIVIFDFGSQYTQLIGRRLREKNIYCEIHPYYSDFEIDGVAGIILSGSPSSVNSSDSPDFNLDKYIGKIPVLGICYGAQLIAKKLGGKVEKSTKREYGKASIKFVKNDHLFDDVPENSIVWMSHADSIVELGDNFDIIASTSDIPVAAFESNNLEQPIYGLQFHPEVVHTEYGAQILFDFANICNIEADWTPKSFVEESVSVLREKLNNDKVILGLSGGVDSTVAAALLHKAIGSNLYCIFIDNGLLRLNEFEEVLESYKHMGLNVIGIRAEEEFLSALEGVSDPEKKRKAIGRVFIEIFDREAHKINDVKWLAQGTIYPDVIESVSVKGPSATIKSHHNVGGLPEKMNLKIVEPLRMLFKDEVRRIGNEMKVSKSILGRHPFPGPGLGIRILGEVSKDKVSMLQKADYYFIKALRDYNLYNDVWQALVVLLPVKSVGVMGDERTYESTVVLRSVSSVDGMTAEWSRLPYDFLAEVSSIIINNVKGINRVVYDISTKPPATIEWE